MHSLQMASGLPWWATFASSTVFVRLALFPLVRKQLYASRKLAYAMPELNFLFQLLRQRLKTLKPHQSAERMRIFSVFINGVNACLTLHEASIMTVIAYPLANLAVFVTFVYSLRSMINGEHREELSMGGFSWFSDLTAKDSSYLLPLSAVVVSYSAIEIALSGSNTGRILIILKDAFQTLLLVSMPLIGTLPNGVFFYWIPSSLCGIAQTAALRMPFFQRLLRLPTPPKPPHLRGPSSTPPPS